MTLAPIALLVASNIFMTIAWYGHLKFTDTRIWIVILASWGIALFEYCLAVPANRIGYLHGWSASQLKIAQEVITLLVFAAFAYFALGEQLGWRHVGAFSCMVGAVCFLFLGKS